MILFLLIFFCLISTPVYSLPASGVTLHIDISMFVSGLKKDVAILDYGVVDELTMRLASSIAMYDNVTYAEFKWATDNLQEPENYNIIITSDNYKVLQSDVTGIEQSGIVPTQETQWRLNLRCIHVAQAATPMNLALQLYSPDGTKEFTGINVAPKKICQTFRTPACTKYPEGLKEGSNSKIFTISSLNYYDSILKGDDDERIEDLSNYMIGSKSHIFVIQNMNKDLQEQLMINTYGVFPFHISIPRINEESILNSGLLILSAKPIVVCDYVEFNEYDEYRDNGKLYGAVIAGIEIGQNRMVFVINLIQPAEESDYSADYDVYLTKLNKEVNDVITKYKSTHKDMLIMTVYTGYFAADSGDSDATTVYYNDITEQLHVVDAFNSTDWEVTDNLKHVRSEFILIPRDNKEFFNEEINIESTKTMNISSSNSYEFDGEEMKLVSPHRVVTATFRFWPSSEPGNDEGNAIMRFSTLLFVILFIIALII